MVTTFNAEKFLDVARELSGRQEEECLRTALGRAYYSVFTRWRDEVANEKGIHPHKLRHVHFRDHVAQKQKFLADLVQGLEEKRICADYRTTNPARARQRSMLMTIDQKCARAAIADAERAHRRFQALYP